MSYKLGVSGESFKHNLYASHYAGLAEGRRDCHYKEDVLVRLPFKVLKILCDNRNPYLATPSLVLRRELNGA